jgi:hypothetical protein
MYECRKCGNSRVILTKFRVLKNLEGYYTEDKPYGIQHYCDKCGAVRNTLFKDEGIRNYIFNLDLAYAEAYAESGSGDEGGNKEGVCSSIW